MCNKRTAGGERRVGKSGLGVMEPARKSTGGGSSHVYRYTKQTLGLVRKKTSTDFGTPRSKRK